jgi:hypothetical protein
MPKTEPKCVQPVKRPTIPPKKNPEKTWADSAMMNIGSALGVFVADCILYPLDSINTLVKIDKKSRSTYQIFTRTINKKGISQFYKGLNTQFLISFFPSNFSLSKSKNLPIGVIYFYSYEFGNLKGKEILEKHNMPG